MSYTEATIIVIGGIAATLLAGWAREGWRRAPSKTGQTHYGVLDDWQPAQGARDQGGQDDGGEGAPF